MQLNDFLSWMATSVGASVVASFILEKIPAFTNLTAEIKKWIFFGVCAVLAVGSYLTLTYVSVEILTAVAPYFGLIATIFASVFGGESFHKVNKLVKPTEFVIVESEPTVTEDLEDRG
jgi:hypothetical protein